MYRDVFFGKTGLNLYTLNEKSDMAVNQNSETVTIEELRDLKEANTRLLSRLDQLSSILDKIPGMAFRCVNDDNLTFEYASQGSNKILGYPPEQIVSGYAFRQLVHPDDQLENCNAIDLLTVENSSYNLVYRIRASWDEYRWVHEQGSGIFSEQGKLVAIEGILTDITDQKQREIKLREENLRLRSSIKERYRLGHLIGKSPAMQVVYERILKAASSKASVAVNGESGTGKELAARTIHELSDRKHGPFVAVNCGAISEGLLESEFFGHIKGAFTGAHTDRDGFLKAADGGTLFLDEIGEMPLTLQVKLLRVLDDKSFIPVGGVAKDNSDFRLISATNRNLGEMVRLGKMREDFYYRINTVPLLLPPLRERKEDLPLLIDHFVKNYSDEVSDDVELPPDFYQTMKNHSWPGNVRELQNVIRRYLTLEEISFSPAILPKNYPSTEPEEDALNPSSAIDSVRMEAEKSEKEIILQALKEYHYHIGHTANSLGVSRRTLQRKMNKYKLR